MDVAELEKNVDRARNLVWRRRDLAQFIEGAPQTKRFWIAVPSISDDYRSLLHSPTVYIDGPCPAFAIEAAKEQIADIERQLLAMGVSDWGEQSARKEGK